MIEKGIYRGKISLLVIMEIILALRKILFKSENLSANQTNQTNDMVSQINDIISDIVIKIFKIPNLVIETDLNEEGKNQLGDIFWNALKMIHNLPGKISPKKGYKFLGLVDIFHILVAKELECDLICTNDKAFLDYGEIKIRLLTDSKEKD